MTDQDYRIYSRFSAKHGAAIDAVDIGEGTLSLSVSHVTDGHHISATAYMTREHAIILRAALDIFLATTEGGRS